MDIVAYIQGLLGQISHQGYQLFIVLQPHNRHFVHPFVGQLRFDIKGADGINLVAEEIQTERIVGSVTVDVHYASAYGKLSGFVNEVHALESQLQQSGCQADRRYSVTCVQGHAVLLEAVGCGG